MFTGGGHQEFTSGESLARQHGSGTVARTQSLSTLSASEPVRWCEVSSVKSEDNSVM